MHILCNTLDQDSKAMSEGIDKKEHRDLYEHIGLRFKIMYGHLDYMSIFKCDPIGLAALGQIDPEPQPKPSKQETRVENPGMKIDDNYKDQHLPRSSWTSSGQYNEQV